MKKILLAAAIIGMTGFAFGQQQQSASTTKTAKCSKACMKSCGKGCTSGTCTHNHAGKSSSTTTSTTTKSTNDKK